MISDGGGATVVVVVVGALVVVVEVVVVEVAVVGAAVVEVVVTGTTVVDVTGATATVVDVVDVGATVDVVGVAPSAPHSVTSTVIVSFPSAVSVSRDCSSANRNCTLDEPRFAIRTVPGCGRFVNGSAPTHAAP